MVFITGEVCPGAAFATFISFLGFIPGEVFTGAAEVCSMSESERAHTEARDIYLIMTNGLKEVQLDIGVWGLRNQLSHVILFPTKLSQFLHHKILQKQ